MYEDEVTLFFNNDSIPEANRHTIPEANRHTIPEANRHILLDSQLNGMSC